MSLLEKLSPTLEFWEWMDDGACREHESLFYNREDEPKGVRRAKERQAQQICAGCPVLQQCRDYALESGEHYGVWGGLTESDRHRILNRQRTG